MEDKENQEKKETGKRIKQQITIPFLWEESPGTPKKDWKPKREPLTLVPLPTKYVASVPFKWEEKPGTPLHCFARESTRRGRQDTEPPNKSLPLPPGYFTKYDNESDDADSFYDDDYDDHDWISEFDFEALSNQSEESFSSAPSLMAPLKNPFLIQQSDGHLELPSSPESSKNPKNNYATGNTSLRGAAILQHMFPLYPPKSGFLDKGGNSEERRSPTLAEHKKLRSGVIRRPLTLGELIMASRRRSYRRKAVHMKKKNPQKDFTKNEVHGCFNFGDSGGRIAKLLGGDLLRLKLS